MLASAAHKILNPPRHLLVAFVVLAALVAPLHGDQNPILAQDFPAPDQAEIISVAPGAIDGPKVNLNAAQAAHLVLMLRALDFTGPAGACDKMQYILRFYAKGKVIATDGICFHCGCFVALDANLQPGDAHSFDLTTAKSQDLESRLAKLFPSAK